MDELRIHQLTKEMVAEELRRMGDPCVTAAGVVRATLSAALQNSPEGTENVRIVEDVVKGAITALLIADHSLTRGAMLFLEVVLEVSQPHLGPTEAMGAALKGLADLSRFVGPARLQEIRVEIESKYMGAGDVFAQNLQVPLPTSDRSLQ
jgi:hypothetical protein